MSENFSKLLNVAYKGDSTVLITGETGTGKSSLARQIHERSRRRLKPFVSVNLASLHEGTLESELFGHERGAFTGADRRREGRLWQAQGGTVFLDEVGELSPKMQARLLEFLQSRTLTPVGGNHEVRLDVRVIAATHKDLSQAVLKGEFRQDLFHRLQIVSIPMASLKERHEDFDHLVHECIQDICSASNKSVLKISEGVAERLETYDWPGNIRELRNVLEFAVQASEGSEISLEDLPQWFTSKRGIPQNAPHAAPVLGVAEIPLTLDFQGTLQQFEKEYLHRALSRNGGRVNRTARQIGLNKTTLIRKIRAYGLSIGIV